MKLSPVKNYCVNYPDIYQVDVNQLLLAHRPNRWKSSGIAALLLCSLSTPLLSGCNLTPPQSAPRKMNMAPIFSGTEKSMSNLTTATKLSFHNQKTDVVLLGNYPGPGSSMPLTEDAALIIIENELKNKGITSKISNKIITVKSNGESTKWAFDLNINGAKEPIYAEFIPSIDMETVPELSQRQSLKLSSTPKQAALELREKLCQVEDESTGVIFYADSNVSMFGDSNQNLINQVNEFVTWLKTSGLV